jgi:hypothetical protein
VAALQAAASEVVVQRGDQVLELTPWSVAQRPRARCARGAAERAWPSAGSGAGFSALAALGGASSGALVCLMKMLRRDDAELVQDAHRDGQRQLRDHVGRRHDGGDDEGADDEVAAELRSCSM